MLQLWKRYAAAMEKVCSGYREVCSSYGKGMQQLWKWMLPLWKRGVEVTNLGIVSKPYKDERKLRGDTPSTK